jgi:hypothetical protein
MPHTIIRSRATRRGSNKPNFGTILISRNSLGSWLLRRRCLVVLNQLGDSELAAAPTGDAMRVALPRDGETHKPSSVGRKP